MTLQNLIAVFVLATAPLAGHAQTDAASQKIFSDYLEILPRIQLDFAKKANTPLMRTFLRVDEAHHALARASTNRVTSLASLSKYDPDGPIGFCFGRAFATQTFASMHGLKDSSIRKLFIVGDLRSNPTVPEWGFHVTTLVLGPDRKWIAIDPIYTNPQGKNVPVPASVWIKWVRKNWDRWHKGEPRAILYLTEGSAMMPDVRKFPEGIINSRPEGIPVEGKPTRPFVPSERGISQDLNIVREFEDKKVFVLSPEQTNEFFLHFNGRREDRNFDFVKLRVQTEEFHFRDYFVDFNISLMEPAPANRSFSASQPLQGRPTLGLNIQRLMRNLRR